MKSATPNACIAGVTFVHAIQVDASKSADGTAIVGPPIGSDLSGSGAGDRDLAPAAKVNTHLVSTSVSGMREA